VNANEIADKLEQGHWEGGTREQAATMLRQQQAEIEALKKEAALQRLSDFTQEAEKTLTDEEIKEVWMKRPVNTAEGVIDFARAILKKAQDNG